MAGLLYADRVAETSTAVGTGNLTLNGAEQGAVSFFSKFSNTQDFEYEIADGTDSESGRGRMLDAHTLQRLEVKQSTNGDTFVNFDDKTKRVTAKITGSKQTEVVKQIVRIPVRNETGSTLNKMAAVAVTGWNTTEGLMLVGLADKDTAVPAIGLVESNISQNSNGYVIGCGPLEGLNTSAWSDRDPLMLGDAGALVIAAPSAGALQVIGSVIRDHATEGVIFVTALQSVFLGLLKLTGGTMSGAILMGNQDLTGIKNSGYGSGFFDAGDKTGASQTLNWTSGNLQRIRLTGNVSSWSSWTAPPAVTGGLILKIEQDGTGGRTSVWPSSVIWDRTAAPTLSTGAGVVDAACGFWDGTNYRLSFFKGSA